MGPHIWWLLHVVQAGHTAVLCGPQPQLQQYQEQSSPTSSITQGMRLYAEATENMRPTTAAQGRRLKGGEAKEDGAHLETGYDTAEGE